MVKRNGRDLLGLIPSANVIEQRLAETRSETEQLEVLLRLSRELEESRSKSGRSGK